MSNSLIPMGGAPSNQEKAEMARLLQIMNSGNGGGVPAPQAPQQAHYSGGYAGTQRPLNESHVHAPAYTPSFGTSREEVDAMKNIMEKLNQINGDDRPAPRQQTQALTEASHFAHEYPGVAPAGHNGPFTVLVQIVESNGKEVNRYNVVDSARQDVVTDLTMKESATAIMKLMNKGNSSSSAKVQEVLDLEEEFNRNRIETGRHRQRYQRSMELGETAAANVFKDRFNVAKANALIAQDTIKSINESLR